MNFTTYHSSCYRIETRTSKNSDELRAIEFPPRDTQQILSPRNLDRKRCQILQQNIAKTAETPTYSSECSRNRERIFSRPTRENPW